MKKINNNNSFFKIWVFSFVLLSNFLMFSAPGTTNTTDDMETTDGTNVVIGAPIDSQILLLAFAGLGFAIYTFNKNRKSV